MTIKELKAQIQFLDENLEIYIQSDEEGNSYLELRGIYPNAIISDDDDGSLEFFDTEWSCDDAEMDEEEWDDFLNKNKRSLILFP